MKKIVCDICGNDINFKNFGRKNQVYEYNGYRVIIKAGIK